MSPPPAEADRPISWKSQHKVDFELEKSCGLLLRAPVRTDKASSFATRIAAIFHMLPITGPFPAPPKRPLAHDTVLFQETFLFQNLFASHLHGASFFCGTFGRRVRHFLRSRINRWSQFATTPLASPRSRRSDRCTDAKLTVLSLWPDFARPSGYCYFSSHRRCL